MPKESIRCYWPTRLTAAVVLLAATGAAAADRAAGHCDYKSISTSFKDAVAYRVGNPFEPGRMDLVIVLSNVAFDRAAISAAANRPDEVRDQAWRNDQSAKTELHVDESQSVWALNYNAGGSSFSQSGSAIGEIRFASTPANRTAATFTLKGDGKQYMRCQINFDLEVLEVVDAADSDPTVQPATVDSESGGTVLPVGGGEAGRAYQAHLQALRSGSVADILSTLVKARADQMSAHRNDPDFDAMLAAIRDLAPRTITVSGGRESSDQAELAINGIDNQGKGMRGLVVLLREDGAWKVDRSSFKSNEKI